MSVITMIKIFVYFEREDLNHVALQLYTFIVQCTFDHGFKWALGQSLTVCHLAYSRVIVV